MFFGLQKDVKSIQTVGNNGRRTVLAKFVILC